MLYTEPIDVYWKKWQNKTNKLSKVQNVLHIYKVLTKIPRKNSCNNVFYIMYTSSSSKQKG